MTDTAPASMWSAQQQAWLQAMGYTVYLEGSALDALALAQAAAPAPIAVENEPPAVPAPRAAPVQRREAPQALAPETPVTTASRPAPVGGRRGGGLRMPDRLQIALLRASGCNPNDPQTRALMDSWPLAELRANPAAKRALWPQLRALREAAAVNARAREPRPAMRPMFEDDLDAVMEVELRAYPFPWTPGIFQDCLRAGYPGRVLLLDGRIAGYGMLSLAADEAHVLNVCVDPQVQSRGHGRQLLRELVRVARLRGAVRVFLEVRPSNTSAIALYHSEGFNEIGRRPRYYPADNGREDALVMAMELVDDDITRMPPL